MLFLEKFGCGDCWQLESSCQNRAAELIKKGEKTKDFNSEILSKLSALYFSLLFQPVCVLNLNNFTKLLTISAL